MATALTDLFPDSTPVYFAASEESRADWAAIPAKGAVYLLVDAGESGDDRPLLLATVGDLRSALKRRLAETPPEVKTKRILYGQIASRILWRRVDSSFAANQWYWKAARELFPDRYHELIPWRSSWWIAVDRQGPFPRLKRTSDLSDPALQFAGPIRDRASAAKLIETVEDLFDLCRYHQELIQAPHGKACAYKEMGKCPAPCDGSVPVSWYREQMTCAWQFLIGPARQHWQSQTEQAMKSAAARLEFETANRLKQRLARAAFLNAEPFAHLAPLESFSFLTLQPGKGKPWLEPWFMHAGEVQCLPQIHRKDLPAAAQALATRAAEFLAIPSPACMHIPQSEQIAIAAHHLFKGEADHGVWLRLSQIAAEGPSFIQQSAEELLARKAPKPLVEQSSEQTTPTAIESQPDSEPLSHSP